jgi:uncharacterized protein (DUF58 family)
LGLAGAYPIPTAIGATLAGLLVFDRLVLVGGRRGRHQSPVRLVAPNPVSVGDQVTVAWSDPQLHRLADAADGLPPGLTRLTPPGRRETLVQAERRGVFDWPGGRIGRVAPFDLVRVWTDLPAGPRLVVWPPVAPVVGPRPDGEADGGRVGPRQPSLEDVTLRDYRPGDEWRRVHWRSSARRGRLMTRTEEPGRQPVTRLRLALDPTAPWAAGERAIALAASWAVSGGEAGWTVELEADGLDPGDNARPAPLARLMATVTRPADARPAAAVAPPQAIVAPPAAAVTRPLDDQWPVARGAVPELLDQLAALDWSRGRDLADQLAAPWEQAGAERPGLTLALVAPGARAGLPPGAAPPSGVGLMVLVGPAPTAPDWRDDYERAGWTVLRSDPDRPLAEACLAVGEALARAGTRRAP